MQAVVNERNDEERQWPETGQEKQVIERRRGEEAEWLQVRVWSANASAEQKVSASDWGTSGRACPVKRAQLKSGHSLDEEERRNNKKQSVKKKKTMQKKKSKDRVKVVRTKWPNSPVKGENRWTIIWCQK